MEKKHLILWVALASLLPVPTMGTGFFIYPNEGQSRDQQDLDEAQCRRWAIEQSGFDPMNPPGATRPPPQQEAQQGGLLRGGARGAALGAVGGAIAGDAGKGAAIGAATGGLLGGMRRSDQRAREDQAQSNWEAEQRAVQQQGRANFDRAFKGCMSGRGYTVS